jgi:hypothetical protein
MHHAAFHKRQRLGMFCLRDNLCPFGIGLSRRGYEERFTFFFRKRGAATGSRSLPPSRSKPLV